MTKTATPWGTATLVERLILKQQAGDKRFSSVVELLETERGERLVRFAYSTAGTTRRGPVPLRERDVERPRARTAPPSACGRRPPSPPGGRTRAAEQGESPRRPRGATTEPRRPASRG